MPTSRRTGLFRSLGQTIRVGEFVALYGCLPALLLVSQPGRWATFFVFALVAAAMAVVCVLARVSPAALGIAHAGRRHLPGSLLLGFLGFAALLAVWWATRVVLGRAVFAPPHFPPAGWAFFVLFAVLAAVIHEWVFRAVLFRRYAEVLPPAAVATISAAASGWASFAVHRAEFALVFALSCAVIATAYRRHPSFCGAVILHVIALAGLAAIGYAPPVYRPW